MSATVITALIIVAGAWAVIMRWTRSVDEPLSGPIISTAIIVGLVILATYLRRQVRDLHRQNELRTKEREAVIAFLHKIGERITKSIDLQGSLEIITNFIVEYTHAESGAIFLLNEEDQTLRAQVVMGMFPPLHKTTEHIYAKRKFLRERIMRDRIALGEGIIGYVAQTGEPQLIINARNDPRIPDTAGNNNIESLMVAPLRIKETILGVMAVVNKRDGQNFNPRDMSLLESLSDQAAVTVDIVKLYDQLAKQHRLEKELEVAREFQQMLLPKQCPQVNGIEIAAFSEPALEVGGDYFDFLWIDEEHLGIVIGDVSGKGIPGALVMAMVRSILRAECRNSLSPADVLRRVNEYIRTDTKANVFITMTYAVLDIKSRLVRFARAGHEPLITCNETGSEPSLFTPEGIALGLVGEEIFNITVDSEITLANGDMVVLYTDGVVEAMNDASEEFGQNRFLNVIKSQRTGGAGDLINAVMEDIRQFTRGIPQHDDITIITLKVKPQTEAAQTREETATGKVVTL